jgi:hypothetical protein
MTFLLEVGLNNTNYKTIFLYGNFEIVYINDWHVYQDQSCAYERLHY